MTVVCEADDQMIQQVTKQLAKQEDVRDVKVLEPEGFVNLIKERLISQKSCELK